MTGRIEELLQQLDHRAPHSTAQQLMMVRTAAVVSCALDGNAQLNQDFRSCWTDLIEAGLPRDPRG